MADNKTIKDSAGTDFTLALLDISSVFFPKGVKHNASGNADAYGSGANGATVPRVALATDSPGVGVPTKVSVNFNRPANTTAYTANDAVNDNATAGGGSSTELTWAVAAATGTLRRVRVKKSDQTVATPTIRLWLYDTIFASGAGDNEAFVHPATDSLGFVDVAVTTAGTDDAVGWSNCDIPFTAATLYGQLQTLSAFTPASGETFTVDLWYAPG